MEPSSQTPGPSHEALLARLRAHGAQPFLQQVVKSPWNHVIDVESLHRGVKENLLAVIDACGRPEAVRCLTVFGPPGHGKTHLLAWVREQLDTRNDAVFIYVPPYNPETGPFENHVLRATLETLRFQTRRQAQRIADAVHRELVRCYDQIALGSRRFRDLNAPFGLTDWLFPSRMLITSRPVEAQKLALRRAMQAPAFLDRAFDEFEKQQGPIPADGARLDRDAFRAMCLLVAGEEEQGREARRWLEHEPSPGTEPGKLFPQPCLGLEKVRNVLLTLNRLGNQSFCLAFDQMEDTYEHLQKHGRLEEDLRQMAVFLRSVSVIPRFCLLFMFQQAHWIVFQTKIPTWFRDRMTEGYGAQPLRGIEDRTARELIRQRMTHAVWSELSPTQPPADAPFFPFTEEEIRKLRHEAVGELRGFLMRAHAHYNALRRPPTKEPETDVAPEPPPPPPPPPPSPPPLELLRVEPAEVPAGDRTPIVIHARNLPEIVEVFFASARAERVQCRPNDGQIDVTTPAGLRGEVVLRVQSPNGDPEGVATTLRFVDMLPKPYAKHLDRKLLRKRREELKLAQAEVARRLGKNQTFISRFELGESNPPDDLLEILVKDVYKAALVDFLKKPTS